MLLNNGNEKSKEHIYKFMKEAPTILIQSDKPNIFLNQLFGLSCGFCGDDEGPQRARGLVLIKTSLGRFEAEDLILQESSFNEDSANIVWHMAEGSLQIESNWTFCTKTGIISRKDRIKNIGKGSITVFGCYSRFPFSPASYGIYSQGSRWCNES